MEDTLTHTLGMVLPMAFSCYCPWLLVGLLSTMNLSQFQHTSAKQGLLPRLTDIWSEEHEMTSGNFLRSDLVSKMFKRPKPRDMAGS